MSYPVVTGWHPKPTTVAIADSSGRRTCRTVTWLSTSSSGFHPRIEPPLNPSVRPLAPVDRELDVGLAPDHPGRLEPLGGEPADGDDLVLEHAGERIDRRGASSSTSP